MTVRTPGRRALSLRFFNGNKIKVVVRGPVDTVDYLATIQYCLIYLLGGLCVRLWATPVTPPGNLGDPQLTTGCHPVDP